jgi:hypothetical protein
MDPIERLRERERLAELGGGEERLKKRHAQGKLTARERVTRLFDAGTFEEVDKLVTHRCQDFGMEQQIIPATASSVATAASTAAWSTPSRRTSRCSAARSLKPTPRRFARSWTWRRATARRLSA